MLTISEDEVLCRLEKAGFNVRAHGGIQFSDASGEMVYTQGGGCACPDKKDEIKDAAEQCAQILYESLIRSQPQDPISDADFKTYLAYAFEHGAKWKP